MKKTKLFAVVMAAVMTLSMVACGEQTSNDVTPTTAPTATTAPTEAPAEPTKAPEPQNVTINGASVTFEDGNMGFVAPYMQHATSADLELSIVDYNGSKALKVVNLNGKTPWLAIDASSLLGANVANVASVDMVVGTSRDDGDFYATSGQILSWFGTDLAEGNLGTWSVYMEKKNPKIITGTVAAGNELVADANNILLINLKTDNGKDETGAPATIYIDDITFMDAAGNVLTADTTVAFNEPAGFSGGDGPDLTNLYAVSNAVEFPGFACSGDGWAQNGFEMPQEFIDALVPGTVVEIAYTSEDGDIWIVMPWAEAGWIRVAQGQAYINNSKTVAQIPYEKFVELCGEDKATWGAMMQCEGSSKWEVFSVKVGTASQRMNVANAVEFAGFACAGDGWAQNGFEMPQEFIDALVPGSVIEIDYTSEDGALWIVMPWAEAGWMRCGQGTAACDGSKCYVTYEQIEEMCGPDKATWGAMMQCEGSAKWEVYGLRVGTKVAYPVISGLKAFDGFACAGDAWAQNGIEMPQEVVDALVPGAVIEIAYTSEDGDIWIVMPWAEAGWMRCAQGAAVKADGLAYITYEQIAAACGEDKATWGAMMQFEGSSKWEVFGIRIGQGVVAAAGGETEAPKLEDPLLQTADGTVAFTSSKTYADSAWWTQLSMTKEEIIGTTPVEEISAIKFTADTNFVIGYKDVNGNWIQTENVEGPYVIKTMELGDAWDLCLALSKGDGVEYTITWEVYTGGDKTVVYAEAEEPAAPALPETVITAADGKGTVAAADASWWTQIALTKDELLAGVALENVTGFKFTGDTDFIIAYNDGTSTWIQKDAASSFELTAADINFADDVYYFCFVLSKGDSVVYNLAWEVLTAGGAATEEPAAEGVTGTFASAGTYLGNWKAETIPADAFAGCENGAEVTINFDREAGRTYWNFTCVIASDIANKYTDAKYYTEQPNYNEWGFLSFGEQGNSYTFKFTAEAVAAFVADGGLGLQTDGVIFNDYVVTPVK